MIENRISGYLYNEVCSEINEEKWTAFQSMAWSLLLIKMLLKTAQLLSKQFPSGLVLCITYFIFQIGKGTSAIPQPNVQHLVYVFPIFFRFHECFDTSHLIKNILINKFFSLKHVFLYSFTSMTQKSCGFLFLSCD